MPRVSGKQKLVTLHVNGVTLDPGMAEFINNVLHACATRSQYDMERSEPGSPTLHTSAAGDLMVYVNNWTV